jgi:hypothetical protein
VEELMQPLPLTRSEVIAVLSRRISTARANGLTYEQALVVVSRELRLDPVKLAVLVPPAVGVAA